MNRVIISCGVLKEQVMSVMSNCSDQMFDMQWLDPAMHRYPDQLRESLQEAINDVTKPATIIIGYGMCSNGLIGITVPNGLSLVIPRCDDCISILLGSREEYYKQFNNQPGTYYFTKGWVETCQDPLKEFFRLIDKYDLDNATWIVKEQMRNYKRTVFIKTSVKNEDAAREYTKTFAHFFQLNFEEIAWSNNYIQRLVWGPWEEDFIIAEEGDVITRNMFE